MHIVIMGCGRVGSTLAHILEDRGTTTVAVIDRDPEAFRRLRPSFKGDRVTGIGFDRDVLARAGIERADGFAAVSSGDNSNIIAARVARETFGVQQVAARIYDPRRAEVYERLGIPTVATVRWTADQMLRKLLPESTEPLWRDATGKVVLSQVSVCPEWIGEPVKTIEASVGHQDRLHRPAGRGHRPPGRYRAPARGRRARDRQGSGARPDLRRPRTSVTGVVANARRHRRGRGRGPLDRP